MLPSTRKTNLGFTLIELLVGVAILAGLSILSVQLLSDTLSSRTKQLSIENSNDFFRSFTNTLTKAIEGATSVEILDTNGDANGDKIKITNQPNINNQSCRTIKFVSGTNQIFQSTDDLNPCSPPGDASDLIETGNLKIVDLKFLPITPINSSTKIVNIEVSWNYHDNMGNRFDNPQIYRTSIASRL